MRAFSLLAVSAIALGACTSSVDGDGEVGDNEDALSSFHGKRIDGYDRTLPDVDAIGYDIELAVDERAPGSEAYTASVTGTFVATKTLATLELDFEGNEIERVLVNGAAASHTRTGSALRIALGTSVPAGQAFTTKVSYRGVFLQADGKNRDDFAGFGGLTVARRTRAESAIYTSLNWPRKARRWLPLRDHPRDGAMVTTKATFPKRLSVVANGKKVSSKDNDDETRTWRFEALTPMPTYDFFVAASDVWEEETLRAPSSGFEIHSYVYGRDRAAARPIFEATPAAMDFFSKNFGAYRWGDRVSFLEIPMYGGGMENATAIGMDESMFMRGAATDARQVAVHELAHHWSGNLVRISSWNDLWLSEGVTEYLTRRAILDHDGDEAARKAWREAFRDGLAAEAATDHPVRPADPEKDVLTFFDDVVYEKGACVLRMLEQRVGRERFTRFLAGWFERHAFGHASTRDLQKELGEELGEDFKRFFDEWVYGTGHPRLAVTWKRVDAANVDVVVEQVQSGGPRDGFALSYEVELGRGSDRKRVALDLEGRKTVKRVAIAWDPDRVVPDPDELTYATSKCGPETRCRDGYRCGDGACLPQ